MGSGVSARDAVVVEGLLQGVMRVPQGGTEHGGVVLQG